MKQVTTTTDCILDTRLELRWGKTLQYMGNIKNGTIGESKDV